MSECSLYQWWRGEQQFFSVSPTDFDLENWDFAEFEITHDQHNILLEFFEDTRDCSYDWIGMIFSQLLPFHIKRKNKWYCSEWIAYALRISDIINWRTIKIYDRCDLSPGVLFKIINEEKAQKENKDGV